MENCRKKIQINLNQNENLVNASQNDNMAALILKFSTSRKSISSHIYDQKIFTSLRIVLRRPRNKYASPLEVKAEPVFIDARYPIHNKLLDQIQNIQSPIVKRDYTSSKDFSSHRQNTLNEMHQITQNRSKHTSFRIRV